MGLSPSPVPPSKGHGPGRPLRTLLQTTIRTTEPTDSKAGLFPVRSLLLRDSLAEISVVESHFRLQKKHRSPGCMPRTGREGQATDSSIPGRFPRRGFDHDPSAGSPTETLLRLLLSLNNKVQWTSRDVAGSEPPTSLQSEHFTGSFNWLERRVVCTKGRDVVSAS
ncbi:hypothetical protein CQW23_32705 [Capsicum baccatum]|uniref:Uncharacterized protein n=1 Tax=Capsicum baccatum TaxID=33114 RepID=A0A2G2V3X6_CAPBA|nr:hypothetical protein CQW23_32705 [Capsicum baccatum]